VFEFELIFKKWHKTIKVFMLKVRILYMARNLTQDEKDYIIKLYKEGLTYREINEKTGAANNTIAPLVKGIRSLKESIKIARDKGKYQLTDEGRRKLSESGKKSCQKTGKAWTEPERQFKEVLNEIGLGVKFPDYIKEIFGLEDDDNPTIYFQYPLQRYVCDYVDLKNKIVFRVNGDFWHANPLLYDKDNLTKIQKFNVSRDKNKKIYLESKVFEVMEVWESEIKWNRENLIGRLGKLANPLPLHGRDPQFESEIAHFDEDWSERLKELWFKKPKGRPKAEKEKRTCLECGKEFFVSGKRDKKRRKFCSSKCSNMNSRRAKRPTKEELEKDIEEMSWLAIGKKYGVSDNAVRKWAKAYKII